MLQESNRQMHRSANIDIDLLVRTLQVEVVDIKRFLHSSIVDETVDFRMFFDDFFCRILEWPRCSQDRGRSMLCYFQALLLLE